MEFDFQRYIQERGRAGGGAAAGAEGSSVSGYAFGRDAKVMRTLERARPVKMALEASHRLDADRLRDKILSGAVQATADYEARIFRLVKDAAETLGMKAPPIHVTEASGDLGILALSIEGEAFILLDRDMIDRLDEAELGFFIGQQCGHIQNGHVVFLTTAFAMERLEEAFLGWIVRPARFALGTWLKVGELTADRAGLMACGDLHVAARALIRRHAPGSIASPMDMDAVLEEAEENPRGSLMAGVVERDARLPGRLAALRAFEASEIYRRTQGRDGGQSLTSVDRRVESIIKLW